MRSFLIYMAFFWTASFMVWVGIGQIRAGNDTNAAVLFVAAFLFARLAGMESTR